MNKKGFTLVEILSVMVILSLIIVIVATKGFGAFNSTKNEIAGLNNKAIEESLELLKVDIENCNDELDNDVYNGIFKKNSCQEMIKRIDNNGYVITLDDLIENGYVENKGIKDIEEKYVYKISSYTENNKVKYKITPINKEEIEKILAYKIINRAKSITENDSKINGYAMYSETLRTTPGESSSAVDESLLLMAEDDYTATTGNPSYYFRGNVEDNYVTFADMCWRVVRIAGDGSIKLILEDQDQPCSTSINGNWAIPTTTGGTTYTGNYGYEFTNAYSYNGNKYIMNYLKPVTYADISMVRAFYDFQKDKLEDYKSKLKSGNWCLADKAYTQSGSSPNYTYTLLEKYNYSSKMYYDSYVRLYRNSTKEPTLKCTGTIMDKFESVIYNETEIIEEAPMYVSALTADEMVYAGGKEYSSTNGNFYLLNENFKSGNYGFYYFWSLSPALFDGSRDYVFFLSNGGYISAAYAYNKHSFRPAVSLASSAVISEGEGTLEKPYIIG